MTACPGDDAPTGSGTGGDEDMPESTPGPGGPGCGEAMGVQPGLSPNEPAAASQPGRVERIVEMRGDADLARASDAAQAGASASSSLTDPSRPVGATTADPHIHERWGESRKLELSYCINGMPGEDAENVDAYHKMIRALHSTMAEWERVSGANFVHVREDDTPEVPPFVIEQGGIQRARADCVTATKAYFGVISLLTAPQGVTNAVPQAWNDPVLEPIGGDLVRTILLQNGPIAGFGDEPLLLVLRHELGHMMGFGHEEFNDPVAGEDGCSDPDPRPLTPVDPISVMTTPGCTGFSDAADQLTHYDRLSTFFLHHTPRARFETRAPGSGYRYAGVLGEGSEILWHAEGATEGILWRPQVEPDGIEFTDESFPYSWPQPPPAGGWFPNESEVVIPLQLTSSPTTFDLLFYGPGPDVTDLGVLNSGLIVTAVDWSQGSFAVPVIGRFDGQDLGRDLVYLYRPGPDDDTVVMAASGTISTLVQVPQQSAYAYPLAAPYRGAGHPDDIVWFEPVPGRVITWRLGSGTFELAEATTRPQLELGLVDGEHIPAIGDFNGDGRADIMWQGVSNLPAGFLDIEDRLWLSTSTATQLGFAVISKNVGYGFRPFVGDFDGDGIDDIFWHRSWGLTSDGPSASTMGPSFVWYHDETGAHEAKPFAVDGDYSPYVGDFDADGCHDVAWFDAVGDALHVWRCLPGARDFDCGVTVPTPPDHAPVGMHWGF